MRWQSGLGIAFVAALSIAPIAARAQADDPHMRSIQVLRKTVLDQERLDGLATNPPPRQAPAFEALEKRYLEGKLSARQFQQYVLEFKLSRAADAAGTPSSTNRPPPTQPAPVAATNATSVAAAASPSGTNAATPQNPSLDRLAEMEAQMDRIIQEKAARDRALTNQPSAATAAAKTKRERLNELLRELISGKITEEQYKAKWAQLTAEKE